VRGCTVRVRSRPHPGLEQYKWCEGPEARTLLEFFVTRSPCPGSVLVWFDPMANACQLTGLEVFKIVALCEPANNREN
jgi:hypothetical protein